MPKHWKDNINVKIYWKGEGKILKERWNINNFWGKKWSTTGFIFPALTPFDIDNQ